jgi:hypothetical protein
MNKNMNKKGAGMKKGRNWVWIMGIVSVLLLFETSLIHGEERRDLLSKFHPYITVSEEYNNNINLSHTNKIDDFITTVNAGFKFSAVEEKKYGIDLDFAGGFVFYARHHNFDYFSPSGSLNAWYAATPRLTFRVRDYLIRSDAAREQVYTANALPNQYLLSTERTHAIYIRNVVEPSVEYQFAKEGLISVLYRNNIYRNQNRLYEDSMENTINPKLTYQFDIKNGVSLDYYLTSGTYQRSPDQLAQGVTPRYTYRFNPRTSIFGEYHFEWQDFKSPGVDYYVHNPSLGIQYQFSPTLSGTAQVGYFWQIPEQGSETRGPSFNLSLVKSAQRTTYSLSFQGGYTEDYFTAENRGFVKTYMVYGTISHKLTDKMTVGVNGSMQRAIYGNDQKDWIWGISGNASYALLRWLSLSLQLAHTEDHSNISNLDCSQYRAIFTATATF